MWPQGTQRQILSLDVHPSRPHLCASGASGGTLALWDLRFEAPPALHALQEDTAGDVWQVRLLSITWSVVVRLHRERQPSKQDYISHTRSLRAFWSHGDQQGPGAPSPAVTFRR